MKVISRKFSTIIETFDSCEELRDEGIDGVNQIGFEIVEVLYRTHFRHAQSYTNAYGQGIRNAC